MTQTQNPRVGDGKITRRNFLGRAACLSGAVTMPWIIPASARGADGSTAPSGRITVGLIGHGLMGRGHLHRLAGDREVQVLAVCDVDQVRRDEQRKADQAAKEALKHKRFVLLRRERDLPMKQRISLWELYTLNENIAISHILKEDFFTLFECDNIDQAARFLDAWIGRAKQSKLEPFARLCEQLDRWRSGLLNYFIHRISNGLAEAINNNINVLKRVARGFRDLDYFMLKILQRCGNLPPLWQVLQPQPNPLTHTH